MKIVIIDCGMGNRIAIKNMLRAIGQDPIISAQEQDILTADILILPGIGAFDAFMQELISKDLIRGLHAAVMENKTKILGICLGMQLLFESSAEGKLPGLGWINGRVESLRDHVQSIGFKYPHIGWKNVNSSEDSLISNASQFYFVHNYFCNPSLQESVIATIDLHNVKVPVAVKHNNIYGVQFHPEKSHRYGLDFFKRFINYAS